MKDDDGGSGGYCIYRRGHFHYRCQGLRAWNWSLNGRVMVWFFGPDETCRIQEFYWEEVRSSLNFNYVDGGIQETDCCRACLVQISLGWAMRNQLAKLWKQQLGKIDWISKQRLESSCLLHRMSENLGTSSTSTILQNDAGNSADNN